MAGLRPSHPLVLASARTSSNPGAPGIVGWLSKKTIACHGSVQHVVHKAAAGEPAVSRHDDEPNRRTHRLPIKNSAPTPPHFSSYEQNSVVRLSEIKPNCLVLSPKHRDEICAAVCDLIEVFPVDDHDDHAAVLVNFHLLVPCGF